MRAEMHFELNFSSKVDYRVLIESFSYLDWSLFSNDKKIVIIDTGNEFDWIDVTTLEECDDILSFKTQNNESIGFDSYHKRNCFSIILDEKRLWGWSSDIYIKMQKIQILNIAQKY